MLNMTFAVSIKTQLWPYGQNYHIHKLLGVNVQVLSLLTCVIFTFYKQGILTAFIAFKFSWP